MYIEAIESKKESNFSRAFSIYIIVEFYIRQQWFLVILIVVIENAYIKLNFSIYIFYLAINFRIVSDRKL